MKKLYYLTFALAISISLQAQITLTKKTHGISKGDSHSFIFAQAVEEGQAGKSITWDFSGLKATETKLTSHMLNSLETPKGAEMTKANTVIEEFGNNFYFDVNSKGVFDYGIATANSVTKYDVPAVKLKFPFSFGDKVSGEFSGKQITGSQEVAIKGSYDVYADAYGKLILPGGITENNVLRVKQTRSYNIGSAYKEITYRWYSANNHYPLLVITKFTDANGVEKPSLAAYHPDVTLKSIEADVKAANTEESFQTFPNPWGDVLKVEYNLANEEDVQILLFDGSGKLAKVLLTNQKQAQGKHAVELTDKMNVGVYFVKVVHGTRSWTKKVVKTN